MGLQRVLGLGSYQTAWTMLHRFRRAMLRPDRQLLRGSVEVDETCLAITDREEPISPVGRKNKTSKVLVGLAVEMLQPKGFGRIRLRRIENDSDECVVPFVQESIEPATQVRTDGSAAYRSLAKLGYDHRRTVMLGSEVAAHGSIGPPRNPWRLFGLNQAVAQADAAGVVLLDGHPVFRRRWSQVDIPWIFTSVPLLPFAGGFAGRISSRA